MRARAIVMPLPDRAGGGALFGRTLETVLAERPCRVIIESVAGAARAGAGRVRAVAGLALRRQMPRQPRPTLHRVGDRASCRSR